MPQVLQVVRCFSCETFQVDIVKKIPKWTCKMCGEKQTLKKVYGQGAGKDCRMIVQDLNHQRISFQELRTAEEIEPEHTINLNDDIREPSDKNKWSEFLVNRDKESEGEEEEPTNFTFESHTNKRRKVNENKITKVLKAQEPSNPPHSECDPNTMYSYDAQNTPLTQEPFINCNSKWTEFCPQDVEGENEKTFQVPVPTGKNQARIKMFAEDIDFDLVLEI